MKRLLILFLLITLPAASFGEKKPGWRKTDDGYWDRKNLISAGVSFLSFNSYAQGLVPVTISYDRKLKHNITVGGLVNVSRNFFCMSTDSYEVHDVVVFAGARSGYDLKVARKVYFRFGLGAGLGCHHIFDLSSGCMDGPCGELPRTPATKVRPDLLVDMHWVFRVGRNVEMMFAPLFISPSQLIFSPWNDEYYTRGYYNYNLAPVRVCVRF